MNYELLSFFNPHLYVLFWPTSFGINSPYYKTLYYLTSGHIHHFERNPNFETSVNAHFFPYFDRQLLMIFVQEMDILKKQEELIFSMIKGHVENSSFLRDDGTNQRKEAIILHEMQEAFPKGFLGRLNNLFEQVKLISAKD